MDPVTALGLVSSILSFISFGTSLVRGTIQIYDSADGHFEENRSRAAVVREMNRFSAKLLPPDDSSLMGEERALCVLATECKALSGQLLELLNKIRPKDTESKAQSLWSALKNVIHEKEKLDLEQRLDNCRSQLELQLTFLTGRETIARLEILAASAKDDVARFNRLQSVMNTLADGVQVTSISAQAQTQLRQLLEVPEKAVCMVTQTRVLDSLAFSDMQRRYETVDEAHFATFKWIFDEPTHNDMGDVDGPSNELGHQENGLNDRDKEIDDKPSENSSLPDKVAETSEVHSNKYAEHHKKAMKEMRDQAREKLMSWLGSGEGIFHVCGKLGSGKSTLMKYLCDHPVTQAKLNDWAGGRKLVLASFFFWKPGSALQKSLDGLYRSLLHGILGSLPELIPDVFPTYWAQIKSAPWLAQTTLTIPEKEVKAVFSQLIKNQSVYNANCFCFFIDGLDEYEGTAQQDQKAMVDLLCSWARASPNHVKLCVSSREYNVFMNNFNAGQRLRLHELTHYDIRDYVRDKLDCVEDPKTREDLSVTITEKAQGIFLWVTLVVRSIRDEMENGAQSGDLNALLDFLPEELDGLFHYILKSVPKTNRRRAFQTFALIMVAREYRLAITIFAYSFFEEYGTDPQFALRKSVSECTADDVEIQNRNDLSRKKLNGYCKGLVEIRGQRLDFTHRSVSEFLESRDIRDELDSNLQGLDTADFISQLVLADLRCFPGNTDLTMSIESLLHLRHDNNMDREPYDFLETLQSLANPTDWSNLWEQQKIENPRLGVYLYACYYGIAQYGSEENRQLDLTFNDPLLISVVMGLPEYPMWKLVHSSGMTTAEAFSIFSASICFYTGFRPIIKADNRIKCREDSCISILGLLLGRRLLLPSTRISPLIITCGSMLKGEPLTIWSNFLLYCYLWNFRPVTMEETSWFGRAVELFLQHGAERHISFSVGAIDDAGSKRPSREGEQYIVDMITGSGQTEERSQILLFAVHGAPAAECKDLSLRQLIEMSGVNNKDSLLKLLDGNSSEQSPQIQGIGDQVPNPLVQQHARAKDNVQNGMSNGTADFEMRRAMHSTSEHEKKPASGFEFNSYMFFLILATLIALASLVVPPMWKLSR